MAGDQNTITKGEQVWLHRTLMDTVSLVAAEAKTNAELMRLVMDVCYLLSAEGDDELTRQEFEAWRNRWYKEVEAVLEPLNRAMPIPEGISRFLTE